MRADVKIEDGVAVPPRFTHGELQQIVDALDVGQSCFIPTDKYESVRSMVHKCALRSRRTMMTRKREENGRAGLRIWRSR